MRKRAAFSYTISRNYTTPYSKPVVRTRSKTLNKAPISTASYTIQMKNINTKTKILDDRKQNSGIIPSKQLVNVSILDIITSILYHILLWKLHSLVSYISYFEWQLVVTVIAVGYLFWTANKATPVNDKAVTQPALYVSATCPDVNSSPMAKSKRLPQIRTISTIPPTKKTAQGQRNLTSYNNPNSTRVAFTRDTNNWNTDSKYSSKNFKPQLEDIKSSFLLLNKKKVINNKNIENQDHNATKKVLKPQLSETERKKKLVEAMNKFKTKKYWHDSKYERIEGLNWISWK
uniref:HM00031 protein n=1 Tax=Heliconius melpomene TaxID=34740 RepID=D0AB77_HELME|nr:HM00031 [Heliconius melpomene]